MHGTFDDEWMVEAYCWRNKLGNNQWELTPLKAVKQKVSDFIKNIYIPSLMLDLTPYSNLPVFEDDDTLKTFPGGTYEINNYVADITNFPAFLQDGLYRIEISLEKEGQIQSGFIIYWKVYPEIGK